MSRSRAAAWLLFYAAAVVLCTWPLAAHVGTHLPDTVHMCRYDLRLIAWALSWQTHALTTAPSRFLDANVYHPTPHALLYSEAGYGALPFFLPTMLATGNPVLATNLLFLGSLAATAWGLHLLVERATGSSAAGGVAAGTVLTSRWLLRFWAPAAPNYAVLQYMPALIALGAMPDLSRRRAVALAVLLALQAAVSPYVAAAAVVPLGVLALWRCLRAGSRGTARRLAAAVFAGTAVVGVVYLPNLLLRTAEPGLARQSWWGFMRPGPLAVPAGWFFDPAAPTSIGTPLLLLVGVGCLVRLRGPRREPGEAHTLWRHGVLWTGVGLGLMACRGAVVMGWSVPSPVALLLGSVPGFELFRVPARLGAGALLGLAVLAGVAFADATHWTMRLGRGAARRAIRGILAVVLVGASTASFATPGAPWVLAAFTAPMAPWGAFAIVDARLPETPVAAALRAIDGPLLVIDRVSKSAFERHERNAAAMLATIGRWYPLLNGYGGYFPAEYRRRMALSARLPDAAALQALRAATGLEWILVRGGAEDAQTARWHALAREREGLGLRLVVGSDRELLFSVVHERAARRARAAEAGG